MASASASDWFDKVLGPIAISSNQELSLSLGTKTLVKLIGSSAQIFGLAQIGGNEDGAVVTFMNISGTGTVSFEFMALSSSATSLANRFRNPSQGPGNFSAIGLLYGGITYRYDASVSLWVMQGASTP